GLDGDLRAAGRHADVLVHGISWRDRGRVTRAAPANAGAKGRNYARTVQAHTGTAYRARKRDGLPLTRLFGRAALAGAPRNSDARIGAPPVPLATTTAIASQPARRPRAGLTATRGPAP